jgi:hypothetical protein
LPTAFTKVVGAISTIPKASWGGQLSYLAKTKNKTMPTR